MPADMLRAVRQSVCDRIDEYRAIVEDPAFKEYFPVVGESHLKTVPKGFPKDFPYPQYIRCKDLRWPAGWKMSSFPVRTLWNGLSTCFAS